MCCDACDDVCDVVLDDACDAASDNTFDDTFDTACNAAGVIPDNNCLFGLTWEERKVTKEESRGLLLKACW